MADNVQWTAGTKRLRARVNSRDRSNLDQAVVELSLTPGSGVDSWQAAEWISSTGRSRDARTTATVAVTAGSYTLKVRLDGEVIVCTPQITVT